MNQATTTRSATTRPTQTYRRQEDIPVLHFKRFLEAFSARDAADCARGMQCNAKFRVLHVRRTLAVRAVHALAMGGHN